MGSLFANRDQQDTQRDVLMVITPIVVRSQDIPEIEATAIWSGSQNRWSVDTPFEAQREQTKYYSSQPREGIEALFEEEAPVPPSDETMPAPAPLQPASRLTPPPSTTIEPVDARGEGPQDEVVRFGREWPTKAAFSIHVGSYLDRKEAEKRARQLSGMDYKCFMISAEIPRKGFFHRIYIGTYNTRDIAEEECRRYRERREFSRDIHVVDRQWAVGS